MHERYNYVNPIKSLLWVGYFEWIQENIFNDLFADKVCQLIPA